jgi:hypothetical protein
MTLLQATDTARSALFKWRSRPLKPGPDCPNRGPVSFGDNPCMAQGTFVLADKILDRIIEPSPLSCFSADRNTAPSGRLLLCGNAGSASFCWDPPACWHWRTLAILFPLGFKSQSALNSARSVFSRMLPCRERTEERNSFWRMASTRPVSIRYSLTSAIVPVGFLNGTGASGRTSEADTLDGEVVGWQRS